MVTWFWTACRSSPVRREQGLRSTTVPYRLRTVVWCSTNLLFLPPVRILSRLMVQSIFAIWAVLKWICRCWRKTTCCSTLPVLKRVWYMEKCLWTLMQLCVVRWMRWWCVAIWTCWAIRMSPMSWWIRRSLCKTGWGTWLLLLLSVIRPPYRKKKLLSCHLADSIWLWLCRLIPESGWKRIWVLTAAAGSNCREEVIWACNILHKETYLFQDDIPLRGEWWNMPFLWFRWKNSI